MTISIGDLIAVEPFSYVYVLCPGEGLLYVNSLMHALVIEINDDYCICLLDSNIVECLLDNMSVV